MSVFVVSGCGVEKERAVKKEYDIGALLNRAKQQELITSVEEALAANKISKEDSSILYRELSQQKTTTDLFKVVDDYLKGSATNQQMLTVMERNSEYLRLCIAAAQRKDFAPRRDWRKNYSILFPEYVNMKNALNVLLANALYYATTKKRDKALSHFHLATETINQGGPEDAMIGGLSLIARREMWSRAVAKLCKEFLDDPEALTEIYKSVNSIEQKDYKKALGYEIACARQPIDDLKSGKMTENDLKGFLGEIQLKSLNDNEFHIVELFVRSAEQWDNHEKIVSIVHEFEKNLEVEYAFSRLLAPVVESYHERVLLAEAYERTTKIGVAASILYARNDKWPELSQASDFAKVSSKDPFSNRDFLYRTTKNSLLIYSVGPNGKDDNGVFDRRVKPIKDDGAIFSITK